MQSREVVQTFNRTSLSDGAANRVGLQESRENSRQNAKKIMSLRPQDAKRDEIYKYQSLRKIFCTISCFFF